MLKGCNSNISMIQNSNFYKEFYFREIDRKHVLNSAINLPIVVISAIISIYFYLFNQNLDLWVNVIGSISACVVLFILLISLFFLFRSFSNLTKGHKYREIADMQTVLGYEKELTENQADKVKINLDFENYLKDEFAACSAHHFHINKQRTEDIATAKRLLFLAFIFTVIFSTSYLLSII